MESHMGTLINMTTYVLFAGSGVSNGAPAVAPNSRYSSFFLCEWRKLILFRHSPYPPFFNFRFLSLIFYVA